MIIDDCVLRKLSMSILTAMHAKSSCNPSHLFILHLVATKFDIRSRENRPEQDKVTYPANHKSYDDILVILR